MTETRRSVMQGRLTDAVFGALWLGVLGLAAIVMLLLAVAPGIPFVIRVLSAGAMVVMAAWVRLVRREAFPAAGRLRLEASDDALVFQMPGQPAEVVPRADIELIILDESPFGVGSLSVFGPDENLLGTWTPNWVLRPPQLLMRVLKRHGYPYALRRWKYGNRLFYRSSGRRRDKAEG